MTQVATRSRTAIARPLKILVPLIKEELAAGNRAGLEHYRQAGTLLLEAKEQQPYGSWGKWLKKNFELSHQTAYHYMTLAQRAQTDGAEDLNRRFTSVRAAIGRRDATASPHESWRPALKAARDLDAELFAQERQTERDEIQLHRDLAAELVDVGYKALATRLHPDRGGSKDAMVRLKRVRDELMAVAEGRRFI
jgi:hypothetical protein